MTTRSRRAPARANIDTDHLHTLARRYGVRRLAEWHYAYFYGGPHDPGPEPTLAQWVRAYGSTTGFAPTVHCCRAAQHMADLNQHPPWLAATPAFQRALQAMIAEDRPQAASRPPKAGRTQLDLLARPAA